jgi:hypothetical protein
MDLLTTMKQQRLYREISLFIGIRNGLSCTSKMLYRYPHFVFYTRISDILINEMCRMFAIRRRERLPPLYRIPLKRQNARLAIPDAVYGPRNSAEYELFGL